MVACRVFELLSITCSPNAYPEVILLTSVNKVKAAFGFLVRLVANGIPSAFEAWSTRVDMAGVTPDEAILLLLSCSEVI